MRYAYVIEKARTGYSAYIPDLPGCIATGRTRATVVKRLGEGVKMHIAGMREDGIRPPRAMTIVGHVGPMRKAG